MVHFNPEIDQPDNHQNGSTPTRTGCHGRHETPGDRFRLRQLGSLPGHQVRCADHCRDLVQSADGALAAIRARGDTGYGNPMTSMGFCSNYNGLYIMIINDP